MTIDGRTVEEFTGVGVTLSILETTTHNNMNTTTDTFTLDELLLALSGTHDDGAASDAIRMADLVEATGRGELSLSRDLRRLIEAGRVECVKVPYTRIDGTRVRVPAYRVKHDTQ